MTEVNENYGDFVQRLKKDYSEYSFREGERFAFRALRTIIYEDCDGQDENGCRLQLLHELGHAILGHREFWADVERIKIERAAWEKARELAEQYNIYYDEEFVEEKLDSYRDWLHRRSQCPRCKATRFQTRGGDYHCPNCEM